MHIGVTRTAVRTASGTGRFRDRRPGAVLARELTDITDSVRQVPAPPVPELLPPSRIRVADPDGADAELVAEWMNRPHLVTTWEYDWPVARWRNHLRAQVDGAYSRPLILSINGFDRAYMEIYRAAKDSIARCYDSRPHDLGLHGAIADEKPEPRARPADPPEGDRQHSGRRPGVPTDHVRPRPPQYDGAAALRVPAL